MRLRLRRVVLAREWRRCNTKPKGPLRRCSTSSAKVRGLLRGKLLVGHGLANDLGVLELGHPTSATRDTALYAPLMRGHKRLYPRKLRDLAREQLNGMRIQSGHGTAAGHDPAEDARAALLLYRKHRLAWERWLWARRRDQGLCVAA